MKVDKLEEFFNKLSCKMDNLKSEFSNMDKTLALQQLQLKEHIRRTELLEVEVKLLSKTQNRIVGGFILAQIVVPLALKFLTG